MHHPSGLICKNRILSGGELPMGNAPSPQLMTLVTDAREVAAEVLDSSMLSGASLPTLV